MSQNEYIVNSIHEAIREKSISKFTVIVEEYRHDINRHVLIKPESDTRLNILHIMSAQEPISEHYRDYQEDNRPIVEILYEFITLMSKTNSIFDINYRASVENVYNMTAAHIAIQWRNIPMLQALIRYGCDLLCCDCNGQNVQDYAKLLNDDQIMQMINDGIYNSIERRLLQFDSFSPSSSNYHLSLKEENNYLIDYRLVRENSHNNSFGSSLSSSTTTSGIYDKSPPSSITASSSNMSNIIQSIRSFALNDRNQQQSKENQVNSNFSVLDQNIFNTTFIESQAPCDENRKSILNHCFNHKFGSSILIEQDNPSLETKTESEVEIESFSFDSQSTEVVFNENGLELIEERYQPVSTPVDLFDKNSSNNSDLSNHSSSCKSNFDGNDSRETDGQTQIDNFILKMNDTQLYEELKQIPGLNPGPITDSTRKYYQQKYQTLFLQNELQEKIATLKQSNRELNQIEKEKDSKIMAKMTNYNIEFESLSSRTFPFEEAIKCEAQLIEQFNDDVNYPEKIDGQRQTHFVYLLLDPTITENLPSKVNFLLHFDHPKNINGSFSQLFGNVLNDHSLFYRFIASIFYVGKGQSNRPYQHFIDAHREKQQCDNDKINKRISAKTQRIWSIWDQGLGPIYLHFFTGITADEAFTREALIIETLSLFNLTNQISGTYRRPLKLNRRQKSILGTYLLFKFFIIYLLNGERQIKIPEKFNKLRPKNKP